MSKHILLPDVIHCGLVLPLDPLNRSFEKRFRTNDIVLHLAQDLSAQKDETLKREGGGSSIALANCAPRLLPTSSSLQSKCPTLVATNLFSTACVPGPRGSEVVTGSDAASKSFGC